MKIKFNLTKPEQTHVYFSVEQEKREPLIYYINNKILTEDQFLNINNLILEGNYFGVLGYLEKISNLSLDYVSVFNLCNFILKTFILERV
jgi:hypothetical protein